MIWKEISLNEVTTQSVIYFEEEYKDTCSRICDVLSIDCFPTIDEKSYWKIKNGSWEKKSIDYDTLDIKEAFDERLLNLYSNNDSNIVFVSSNNFIKGIIHFTNYENASVYSSLYRNLNVFEKSLREYLIYNGLDNYVFLKYLKEHKLKNRKSKRRIDIEKRIEYLTRVKDEKRHFENHLLSEIMEFSTSSFHSTELLKTLNLGFLKEKILVKSESKSVMQLVGTLRNQVMHHDNISGQTDFTPHNFEEFKQFFELVLIFRSAFEQLSERLEKLNRNKSVIINKKKLDLVSQMEDEEIVDYFYSLI